MNCKVSIVVPCYKVEKYMRRCIDSLLNQTLKEIQVIIVDDGSPDSVGQICEEYAQQDKRVDVVHKKNGGLGYARNSGLELCKGEYVAFVDGDDYVEDNMYELLFSAAKEMGADVVFANSYKERGQDDWVKEEEVTEVREWNGEEIKEFILDTIAAPAKDRRERIFQMSVWRGIYRADIIRRNNIRFYSERDVLSEDLPFIVDILAHSERVIFIPDFLYRYCYNENSLTQTFNTSVFERSRNLYHLLLRKTETYDINSERTDKFYFGYLRFSICRLTNSSNCCLSDKLKWTGVACKYFEESRIDSRLDISIFPVDKRWFYFFLKKKCTFAIYVLCKIDKLRKTLIKH